MSHYYTKGDTIALLEKDEIIVEKVVVNKSVELHKHNFIEIAYVDSGEGMHEIADGFVSHIVRGDLLLFNSGVAHGYRVGQGGSLTIYNCIFDPSVLDASVSRSDDFIRIVYTYLFGSQSGNDQKPYIILKGAGVSGEIIKDMYREYTGKQNGYSKINTANLTRLLVNVFRLKRNGPENDFDAYKSAIADSAIRYIHEYYASKISCDFLAARAFVSIGYFHRIFRDVTGRTPVEYIQYVRLHEAARLLRETCCSIEEAAAASGYLDLKYFYKLFRDEFNMTPARYRKAAGSCRPQKDF